MTILQLEYLLAVVTHGSFSAAARHCFISQSALSTQIQNLEQELGMVLLDRNHKPIVPTEAGLPILKQARTAVEAFRAVKEEVNVQKTDVSGRLRFGIIPSLSPYLLPKFIPEFVGRCPAVELEIRDMTQTDIIYALNRDLLDVAIIVDGKSLSNVKETKLFVDNIYVYVSPRNKLYKREIIREHDLDLSQMLVEHEGDWMREKRDAVSEARKNAKVSYFFMHTSMETMMHLVDATSTFTMIPGVAVDYIPTEKSDRVKIFSQSEASRTIIMAVARNYMSKKIIEAVRESFMVVAEQQALADLLRR